MNPGTISKICIYFAIGLLIIGLLSGMRAIDLQFHATYVVLAVVHICLIIAIYFLLLSLIYQHVEGSNLSQWIVNYHVPLSIVCVIILMVAIYKIPYVSFDVGTFHVLTYVGIFFWLLQILTVVKICLAYLEGDHK